MIKGSDLENRGPAAGLDPKGSDAVQEDIKRMKTKEKPEEPLTDDRLAALERRIANARLIKPSGHDLHCEDCFNRGRDAALRVIDGV